MLSRLLHLMSAVGLLASVAGCDPWSVGSRSLTQWCGDTLCSWQTDAGKIERVTSWHKGEFAASFEETGTQISYLLETAPVPCAFFSLVVDSDADAKLSLLLDYNDDGDPEYEKELPRRSWGYVSEWVLPPLDYRSVRVILRKNGPGRAVLGEFWHGSSPQCRAAAVETRLSIADGSVCTTDASCASGLCAAGRCSSCVTASEGGAEDKASAGTCEEGQGCSDSAHCASGACAGGMCQDCALEGACPAFAVCDRDDACQSGACVARLSFSDVQEASGCLRCELDFECGGSCVNGVCETCARDPFGKQCAECSSDDQCESGICEHGVCGSCRDDSQCAEGEHCRSTDTFDVGPRRCTNKPASELPRGGLCEDSKECAEGLACGAAPGEPKRCGIGCESDPRFCGAKAACTRTAFNEIHGVVHFPQAPLPAFAETAGRIATCYPLATKLDGTEACTLHAECAPGACCDGVCRPKDHYQTADLRTGGCRFPNASSWR